MRWFIIEEDPSGRDGMSQHFHVVAAIDAAHAFEVVARGEDREDLRVAVLPEGHEHAGQPTPVTFHPTDEEEQD